MNIANSVQTIRFTVCCTTCGKDSLLKNRFSLILLKRLATKIGTIIDKKTEDDTNASKKLSSSLVSDTAFIKINMVESDGVITIARDSLYLLLKNKEK